MYSIAKRFFDSVVSLAALLVFAPLFLLVGIAIKLDSNGPVFFVQERMGYKGKVFKIMKFRTMVEGADHMNYSVEQVRHWEAEGGDPRITKVGGWLRRKGIDEFPQLFNVLKGDMSLVGPRPYYLRRMDSDSELKERVSLKPGFISLALVNGGVHLTEEQIKAYDKEYAVKQSLRLDLTILLKAAFLVLSGKGF